MTVEVSVFLPCRSGSKRVPNKNTKPFSKTGESLLELKLKSLLNVDGFRQIILSTDDDKAASQAAAISSAITVVSRPKDLASDQTKISDLSKHAGSLFTDGYVLWSHVTSPLFGATSYKHLLNNFAKNYRENLSLVAARSIQAYLFTQDKKPLYEGAPRESLSWPPTQTLPPVFEVNNAAFLAPATTLSTGERLSSDWEFYECSPIESLDVDTEADWLLAKAAFDANIAE